MNNLSERLEKAKREFKKAMEEVREAVKKAEAELREEKYERNQNFKNYERNQ